MFDREMIECKVREFLKDLLEYNVEQIPNDLSLFTLGLSSLSYIQLIVLLEETFDIDFSEDDLVSPTITIGDLVQKVSKLCP